ncbi:hypothetical protein EV421DRAFT_1736580 [Armillaria borealis]|uniref:Uncharacterized protein n=1 Tax=Armillaria borealis TaxID=47425 RepID=A0AA39JHN5_9AGAR|nr:hypothetical protein EV421DRAFT_1736580 [Armillaria borealis]
MWSSRYSVLSADYDPNKTRRPSSISKPSSVTSRSRKAPPTFRPGQICVVTESVFTPLSEALTDAKGTIDAREGCSLTFKGGQLAAVSSGEERPCIIMDPPPHLKSKGKRRKGYFVCLMATFASSHGDYGRFGRLLRRLVVPVEPNEQILPDSNMDALKTTPAWRNPWQWAISVIIYTERPVKLYRARSDGQGRRLSTAEYNRLVQHCFNQRTLWQRDARENLNLKQEMYEKLVDWKPDDIDADPDATEVVSTYSFRSTTSLLSVGSGKSFYRQGSCRGSVPAMPPILEHPNFTPNDFPPLPSGVCEVY